MTEHPLQADESARVAGRASGRLDGRLSGALLAIAVCSALVCGLGPAFGDAAAVALALLAFLGASALVLVGLAVDYPHPEFGPANMVTLLRLSLVAALTVALDGSAAPASAAAWGVPLVAALALALDGVDGWLARRTGLVSRFGARFDLEVDCALALALALLALDRGGVGPWVLALGLARYVFWAASLAAPWLAAPLPERRSRKWVCVVQIAALVVLVTPGAEDFAPIIAGAALALVARSFALDVRHLWRTRP